MINPEKDGKSERPEAMPPIEQGKRVEVFFDSDCPLCDKEIRLLKWLDRKNRVQFTDVATSDFDASRYNLSFDDFMDEIQGRQGDGTWLTGVEVLRQVYAAIGFGILVAPTRLPGISHAMNWGYAVFAKNRLKWTGRCGTECSIDK